MIVNFLVHKNTDSTVAGTIISVIRSKLTSSNIGSERVSENDDSIEPGIVVVIGRSYDDLYDEALKDKLVKHADIIIARFGLCTGPINSILTEMDSFKIYTMNGIDDIVNDIKEIISASEEEK